MLPIILLLVAALATTSLAQESRFRIKDPEVNKAVVETLDRIKSEAAVAKVDWAGEYGGEYGIDDSRKLWVAPSSGLVIAPLGSDGNHDHGNVGEVSVTSDIISVIWKYPTGYPTKTMDGAMMDKLAIVRWDKNIYLIPLSRLHGFCLTAQDADKRRYNHRDWYRMSLPEPTTSEFVLPEKYRYLQRLPRIEAEVLAATQPVTEKRKDGNLIHQDLEINRGSKDGVYVGMDFQIHNGEYGLTVTEVQESTSRVHYQQTAPRGRITIRKGLSLTTAEY